MKESKTGIIESMCISPVNPMKGWCKAMDLKEAIDFLQQEFDTQETELLLLHGAKTIIENSKSEDEKKKAGSMVIALAAALDKAQAQEQLLLEFFSVTRQAVLESVGSEFLKNHGLYRSLVTSPQLSPLCELFFDAWLLFAYEENPFSCHIRRVGTNAFRIVSAVPGGGEVEYPEDLTADEVMARTTCPRQDLMKTPALH